MSQSTVIYRKLFKHQMEELGQKNWLKTLVYWLTDSQYRKKKRLDLFFADQLRFPPFQLKALANQLRGKEKDNDKVMVAILKRVLQEMSYASDQEAYGLAEYWATAAETWNLKKDDCDGINGLIFILARLAGIPDEQLYANIGDVYLATAENQTTGHFWLSYWSFKYDKLYWIDGTYWPDKRDLVWRSAAKLSQKKYKAIWYTWNDQIIFRPYNE